MPLPCALLVVSAALAGTAEPHPLRLDVETIHSLAGSDDVWNVAPLERAFDAALSARERFPDALPPPDLEAELSAALEALDRLDPASGQERARELLDEVSAATESVWTARRLLASRGALDVVRLALRSYFDDESDWRSVLAAFHHGDDGDEVRLSDFGGSRADGPRSARYLFSRLEKNLSGTKAPVAIRALLLWAQRSKDPAAPRRVLAALSKDAPYRARVDAWLRAHPAEGTPEPPELREDDEDPLALQSRILSLAEEERVRALRRLAEHDDPRLVGVPMNGKEIDALYSYLALSSHRALRDRVQRSREERGAALAVSLLSPASDEREKHETLESMNDAWAPALAAGGPEVYAVMKRLVGESSLDRWAREVEPGPSVAEALSLVPSETTRLRLESWPAPVPPEVVEALMRRSDRILSIPFLDRSRRETGSVAAPAAARALVELAAPGVTALLRAELATERDLSRLSCWMGPVTRAPIDPELAALFVRRLGASRAASPAAFAGLAWLQARAPQRFLALAERGEPALVDRAYKVMSLTGDRLRLPLLVDLASGAMGGVSPSSRDAAFAGLEEAELGEYAARLHRLAGDPDRRVRFHAAAALAPGGDPWTLRLLLGELDPASEGERRIARSAIARLPTPRARSLLEAMIDDGTAGSFGVLVFVEKMGEERPSRALQRAMWSLVREDAVAGDETALLAASLLDEPEAIVVVTSHLTP